MAIVSFTESFGFINNTFINMYTKDNPLLNIADECYFLFNNIEDYHKLLIGRGIIYEDTINDGIYKTYYVHLLEIIENPETIKNFVYDKQFALVKFNNNKLTGNKTQYINEEMPASFYEVNLFKVECFFIRPTLEKILNLKRDFTKVIIDDLNKQLSDLDE